MKLKTVNIKTLLLSSAKALEKISSSPWLDAELLLSFILKTSKEHLHAYPEQRLSQLQMKRFSQLLRRRIQHEPIAYLIGSKEFFGLKFFVNRHTLIPRPQTESLVEKTLSSIQKNPARTYHIIDIGTGTGCILISVAKYLTRNNRSNKNIHFIAIDRSQKALSCAKKNAYFHGLEKKIHFLRGNLLAPYSKYLKKTASITHTQNKHRHSPILRHNKELHIILANLPYITEQKYRTLPKTIKRFEPKSALLAKDRGLFYYKKLLHQISLAQTRGMLSSFLLLAELESWQKPLLSKYISHHFPHLGKEAPDDFPGVIVKQNLLFSKKRSQTDYSLSS